MTPYRPLDLPLPLRPPLRACQGEGRSGGSASCPLLRLLTIGNTWPAPNTPTSHIRRPSGSAPLTFERPRPRPRSRDRCTVAASTHQPPTGQADNNVESLMSSIGTSHYSLLSVRLSDLDRGPHAIRGCSYQF